MQTFSRKTATLLALLAAALYAVNIPLSKLLLGETPAPLFWAGLGIMIIATLLMLKDTFAAGPEGETDP